jgi:hypothetical protein
MALEGCRCGWATRSNIKLDCPELLTWRCILLEGGKGRKYIRIQRAETTKQYHPQKKKQRKEADVNAIYVLIID